MQTVRFNTDYRLNRHHKFKQNDRTYVADLETNAIVEVDEVEWDILQRYGTQTQYQIVEALKEKYKVNAIFDGISTIGTAGQARTTFNPDTDFSQDTLTLYNPSIANLRYWFPLSLPKRSRSLDYITHLNRFHLLDGSC